MFINPKAIFTSSRELLDYVDFLRTELIEVEGKILNIELQNFIIRLCDFYEECDTYSCTHSLLDLKKRKKKLASMIKLYENIIKSQQYIVSKCKYLAYYRRLISRLELDRSTLIGLAQIFLQIIQIVISLNSLDKRTPQFAIS